MPRLRPILSTGACLLASLARGAAYGILVAPPLLLLSSGHSAPPIAPYRPIIPGASHADEPLAWSFPQGRPSDLTVDAVTGAITGRPLERDVGT